MMDCGFDGGGHDFGGDPLGLAFDMVGDVDVCGADIMCESGEGVAGVDFDGEGSLGLIGMASRNVREDVADLKATAVHVVGHGTVDVKDLFAATSGKNGMIRVPYIQVGGRDLDGMEADIVPLSRWNRKIPAGTLPPGANGNSTGRTKWWRQYWQVGKKKLPWSKPVFDREALTFIEVVGITWEYGQTCDCETLLVIRVKSMTRYSQCGDCWSLAATPLAQHKSVCARLRLVVGSALDLARPSEVAQMLRAHAQSELQVA